MLRIRYIASVQHFFLIRSFFKNLHLINTKFVMYQKKYSYDNFFVKFYYKINMTVAYSDITVQTNGVLLTAL